MVRTVVEGMETHGPRPKPSSQQEDREPPGRGRELGRMKEVSRKYCQEAAGRK